ncbi:phage tail protein [Klebsiella pneumoniae]|uniref:phage minor tail protein domain-containing protein n=1 Tax=Klebsiella pneumoniae TaxID=573 RepID=UPI000496BA7A|nr:phage minor tail protein G [Klebsiella pneumoniae]HDU4944684.1 phage tail protein [Klebsiella pneumoniae subsp. ozaenae]EKW9153243.1 phage tail protein [Klebsiella pneumoniae]ELA1565253.1 phage tail protein [Klebsiella pneumoniae]ELA2298511.1 phage tail protein [Klebsiella pneumoniae]ELA2728373.1 phage tail protein [Klebsiella pneumoniae]
MTYLKKDTLNPDGENILLFELSAYSRMQYIEFMVEERKSLPPEESTPEENFKLATLLTMRDQAMLVALSLSEADEEKREGKDIFPEIIRKYPPGLLGSAALLVRMLSGMIPPVNNDTEKTEEEEEPDLEKS